MEHWTVVVKKAARDLPFFVLVPGGFFAIIVLLGETFGAFPTPGSVVKAWDMVWTFAGIGFFLWVIRQFFRVVGYCYRATS